MNLNVDKWSTDIIIYIILQRLWSRIVKFAD